MFDMAPEAPDLDPEVRRALDTTIAWLEAGGKANSAIPFDFYWNSVATCAVGAMNWQLCALTTSELADLMGISHFKFHRLFFNFDARTCDAMAEALSNFRATGEVPEIPTRVERYRSVRRQPAEDERADAYSHGLPVPLLGPSPENWPVEGVYTARVELSPPYTLTMQRFNEMLRAVTLAPREPSGEMVAYDVVCIKDTRQGAYASADGRGGWPPG